MSGGTIIPIPVRVFMAEHSQNKEGPAVQDVNVNYPKT